jgi:hypothetical protein
MVPAAARRAGCRSIDRAAAWQQLAHVAALRAAPKGKAPSKVVVKGMGLGLRLMESPESTPKRALLPGCSVLCFLHGQDEGICACRTVDFGSDGSGAA